MTDIGFEKSVARSFSENVGWLENDSSHLFISSPVI